MAKQTTIFLCMMPKPYRPFRVLCMDIVYIIAEYMYSTDYLGMRLVLKNIPGDMLAAAKHYGNKKDAAVCTWLFRYGFYRRISINDASRYDLFDRSPFHILKLKTHFSDEMVPKFDMIYMTNVDSAVMYIRIMNYVAIPEAEKILLSDPKWACWYSMFVLKKRWHAAEKVIMSDRRAYMDYTKNVLMRTSHATDEIILGANVADEITREYLEFKSWREYIQRMCSLSNIIDGLYLVNAFIIISIFCVIVLATLTQ